MVRFENVSKSYNQNQVVVHELNLTVNAGELVVLIGPSGCGKTTTLKMINRLIEPSQGTIYVKGQDILRVNPVELRRGIGYVIQQIGLFPNLTISENIGIVGRLQGWSKARQRERATELLQLVNMDPHIFMDRYPRELSGGQQQRIGVLRALAIEPDLILMDEPFGALDPITREQLQAELKKIQAQLNKTIIFVTHDMDEALKLADRIVLMREGHVVQIASPDEMLRNPADSFVTDFIGKERLLRSPDDVMVEDVMNTNPVSIPRRGGWAEALERMRLHRVDSLMVVDNTEKLLGVVTAKDVRAGLNSGGSISDHVSPEVVSATVGQTVRQAVHIMNSSKVGYLPVVDESGKLKGLITRASLINILSDVLWPNITNGSEDDTSAALDTAEMKRGDQAAI